MHGPLDARVAHEQLVQRLALLFVELLAVVHAFDDDVERDVARRSDDWTCERTASCFVDANDHFVAARNLGLLVRARQRPVLELHTFRRAVISIE